MTDSYQKSTVTFYAQHHQVSEFQFCMQFTWQEASGFVEINMTGYIRRLSGPQLRQIYYVLVSRPRQVNLRLGFRLFSLKVCRT